MDEKYKRFAVYFAHEMAAPATFIIATAERLLDFMDDVSPHSSRNRAQLASIITHAERQLALCDAVSKYSDDNTTPPQARYNPRFVRLSDIMREAKNLSIPYCRMHHLSFDQITIHCRSPERLFVDQNAFVQVFSNMISNAVKYRNPNNSDIFSVRIQSNMTPQEISISVEDDGIGIPAGCEDAIFESYFRAPGAEQFAARGTGLGLAIVKKIVEDHGGRVHLEQRQNPTTFVLHLPTYLTTKDYVNEPFWRGE